MSTQPIAIHPPAGRAAPPAFLVSELYASVQGESTYAGRPCAFVRLTGCPMRCRWCDSAFAFHGGERIPLDEIVARVLAFGLPLVEVTGGEPLAHPHAPALLRALCDARLEVLLETGGGCDIAPVDPRVIKILDIKCPGSGECDRNRWENLDILGDRDELKFVIANRADYEWARSVVRERRLERRPTHFSPVNGELDPARLAEWVLADRLDVRVHLQLHKYIWPGRTRLV